MAWQSPSAMNVGGANGGGDGNAPAGTEYTLQGMMTLSWHANVQLDQRPMLTGF